MKEIKYRVWNEKGKEFIYWGFIDNGFFSIPTGSQLTIEYCKENSEQLIFKYKEGQEFYEGDIVNFWHFDDEYFDDDKEEYIVDNDMIQKSKVSKYGEIEGDFGDFDITILRYAIDMDYKFKVIGNIHESEVK